jgi:predicted lactoylglutathione lyase
METTGILVKAGFTLQEVESLLATAKDELKGGAVEVTQWRTGDHSATRFRHISTMQMIDECLYALSVLDPDNHEYNFIPSTTRAVFG